jgi:hypothetical protein
MNSITLKVKLDQSQEVVLGLPSIMKAQKENWGCEVREWSQEGIAQDTRKITCFDKVGKKN